MMFQRVDSLKIGARIVPVSAHLWLSNVLFLYIFFYINKKNVKMQV